MKRVVADASALLEYLLRTPDAARIEPVVTDPQTDLHVPALCDVEVAAGLRRALMTRKLTGRRARQALDAWLDLPLTRHGHALLLHRCLALRDNFTAYDAVYLALTERLDAALLTADNGLARAARRYVPVA